MKAFLLAIVAVAVIGFGAAFVLDVFQQNAETTFSTTGARIDKPDAAHGAKPKG